MKIKSKIIVISDQILWNIILYTYGKVFSGLKAYYIYKKLVKKFKYVLYKSYYDIGKKSEAICIVVNY